MTNIRFPSGIGVQRYRDTFKVRKDEGVEEFGLLVGPGQNVVNPGGWNIETLMKQNLP